MKNHFCLRNRNHYVIIIYLHLQIIITCYVMQICKEKLHWNDGRHTHFSRILCKMDEFSLRSCFSKLKSESTAYMLKLYSNTLFCSTQTFFYYHRYICFLYVQNWISFDVRNELFPLCLKVHFFRQNKSRTDVR